MVLHQFRVRRTRSSDPEEKKKKGVLRNFAKFTGKLLCQSLFFNKVVGLRNFAKFLSTPFLIEHLWVAAEINVQIAI